MRLSSTNMQARKMLFATIPSICASSSKKISIYNEERQVLSLSYLLPSSLILCRHAGGGNIKYRSLKSIYKRTHPIEQNKNPIQGEEENLSYYFYDHNAPPALSPARVKEEGTSHQNEILPSSSESFSDNASADSDIETILSPNMEMEVVSKQSEIEEKVFEIAKENGFALYKEEPHVLGQWVHGESSDPSTLEAILADLHEKKEKSEWFSNAIDVYLEQFLKPSSPLEKLVLSDGITDLWFFFTNSSLFMLFTLSLVLLLVHFVTKKRRGGNVPK